jgi:hypothetical protein
VAEAAAAEGLEMPSYDEARGDIMRIVRKAKKELEEKEIENNGA